MRKPFIFLTLVAVLHAGGCGKENSTSTKQQEASGAKQSESTAVSRPPSSFSDFAVSPKPQVTPELLARGKTVYAQNCAACHGLNGDGKGDAAAFLAPKPRDFVKANYRLRSTGANNLPTDVDLFREISLGVPGTPMPPWRLLRRRRSLGSGGVREKLLARFSDTNELRMAITDFGTPPGKTAASIAEGQGTLHENELLHLPWRKRPRRRPGSPDLGGRFRHAHQAAGLRRSGRLQGGYATKEIVRTILTGFNGTPMIGFNEVLKKEEAWKLAYYVETFAKPAARAPLNPSSQNFLSREELGEPDVKIKVTERAWQYDPAGDSCQEGPDRRNHV